MKRDVQPRSSLNTGRQILDKFLRSRHSRAAILLGILVAVTFVGLRVYHAYAETYPGGSDNGQTSRLKSLSDDLQTLGFGSPTNSPDWGSLWNRINTASRWTPPGDVATSDVRLGKKFYNNNRTEQTGTLSAVGPCPTQDWNDDHASANQTANCVDTVAWTVPSPVVTGDDKRDPRTGLAWSQCLINSSGTVTFGPSGCTSWSWDASAAANVAVGGKTASQLCSERGGGGVWRLPTQKELMQAYIDGSSYNLTSPAAGHWSLTQNSGSGAWFVFLSNGTTYTFNKTSTNYVRCVR